ncbi:phosphonate ABC transporter, permease protein PhnE [Terasakiella sp. A23]|uniref:phosphonate ABC transporter, permease protein PhnE n=1 Tax=Terasakiella sp. FCG-A23 TaxID=3080561 RepID=UPI002953FDDD|nr:phosphonate ABC transporter, permease protein PhnE [Terasakiella sp. A23]MDV7340337.1 phosphonate ABC transporter, permease protein PhnE [Terasakiella sp. A23]
MNSATHTPHAAAVPATDMKRSVSNILMWAIVFCLLAASWEGADMRPLALIENAENMSQFASGFFPPDMSQWKMYMGEIWITVQIAIWGTALSIVCSIPFGILSSENIVPWWVYQPVRRLMDAARAINEMVFAMLFVVAVGLGPFAGVLALWIHTTGVLAKLFSEAVEAIDPRPVEGIRATGATALQEVIYGVIPQVLPLWISYSLYRFESNVRSATVLGIVGAGGIGMVLWENIRGFYYAETAAVMILIIISVSLLDVLSQRLRKMVT